MKKLITTALMVLMLGCFSVSASAAEQANEKNWDFSLAPLYLWMVDMEGDIGIGPVDSGVNVDFGTIFDNLEEVFTIHFEAMHRSNWGLFFDYSYLDVSASISPLTIDMASTLIEAGGAYRTENGPHTFDMFGGVRYTKVEPDITIGSPPPLVSISEDWYDPFVGIRYNYDFGDKWMLSARGDIGGFGVGCDFTWNVIALVHFQPWKNAAFIAGYRALDQDYESGSGSSRFAYDMRLAGPVLGLNFVW
jgi:opacity protein-like surface antigen